MKGKGEIHVKDKKVLLFGLGLLGGGVATANWLLDDGGILTIHDIKQREDLEASLKNIRGNFDVIMGRQMTEDEISQFDLICINPDVSFRNPLIEYARNKGIRIINEAVIFYSNFDAIKLAVTGTRGKTTTVNWLTHLLNSEKKAITTGNSYKQPLLKTLLEDEKYDFAVTEMSSYLLELFDESVPASDIAIITNLSSDHQNRYLSMEDYASAKANIFRYQNSGQKLILNAEDEWTEYFMRQVNDSDVWFFSLNKLSESQKGVYAQKDTVYFNGNAVLDIAGFVEKWGEHNVLNFLACSLSAHLVGISWHNIQGAINNLPQVNFRQEVVFDGGNLKVINDTTATSPEGGIAAINRFANQDAIFIFGGTDKGLDYSHWAEVIKSKVSLEDIVLLSGSATDRMKALIGTTQEFDTLEECFDCALSLASKNRSKFIVFSPSSKSFEKFKNEFDRGDKFNEIVRALLNKKG